LSAYIPLSFGIPTLDELIEIPGSDEIVAESGGVGGDKPEAASLALLGPDGAGKSVLALHLASNYRSWCCANLKLGDPLPKILYISSDLQHSSATKVWANFRLDEPWRRRIPFERMPREIDRRFRGHAADASCHIVLQELHPRSDESGKSEADFLLDEGLLKIDQHKQIRTQVGFLDLAQHTAGDDWNYVNALIAGTQSCPLPEPRQGQAFSHLIIIDSVAGFETLMGTYDAYGMAQTRRGRIAQTMRNAVRHAHLVFVVEEPDQGKRLPEEYVTDVVVRLRSSREGSRPTRTVEIEKARARNHAAGEHIFEIRNRRGSSTGHWENPDNPVAGNNYLHVLHSLSHRNLRITSEFGEGRAESEKNTVASFGLSNLDDLLKSEKSTAATKVKAKTGIRSGTTAALIGESGTGKSTLAEKFLAEGLREFARDAVAMYRVLKYGARNCHEKKVFGRISASLMLPSLFELGPHIDDGCPLPASAEELRFSWRIGERRTEFALGSPKVTNHNSALKGVPKGSLVL